MSRGIEQQYMIAGIEPQLPHPDATDVLSEIERLRAAGWTRTPDPMDAPNEASLRFRRDGADCLFNVYEVPRLYTEAEFRVNEAVTPAAWLGQTALKSGQISAFSMPASAGTECERIHHRAVKKAPKNITSEKMNQLMLQR